MTGLTPPATGSETLNEYLRQLQAVVDGLDLRKIPEEGWSLTDLEADVSEVISDKRDIIDVANEAARKLAEVKALIMDLDGYDQSLEQAEAFMVAAEGLLDWYDQNEVAVQALQEMVSKEGGASELVEAFDAIRLEIERSSTAARASETAAAISKTAAANSATAAKASETNSKASETAAKTSETNAKASETSAKTSETNAKASETAAASSKSAAASSASAANTSKNAAATSATNAANSATEAKSYANVVRAAEFRPETYGAVGDGVTDDAPAINQAIAAATQAGGGSVLLTQTYAVGSPLDGGGSMVALVNMYGAGDVATKLIAKSDIAVIGGYWHQSIIENIFIDGAAKGSPCVAAHFDKVTFRDNFLTGWTNYGMLLNNSGDDIGLLNRIERNHIVQGAGVGIWTTYRFVDSWIIENNIGSTGPNLSLEAGPLRVTENHLNGTPEVNIDLRGNQRITIAGNICEGARAEAIRYTMPSWLSVDEPQIQIVGNALSNGGKGAPNTKPAIGIYGVSSTKRVKGFNIVGNIMACQDEGSGWNYAVQATNAAGVIAVGNQWDLGFTTSAVNGDVTATGNTSGNKIPAADIGASTATTANTVALRTSAGRLTAANPSGTTDVVNKGTMDTALAAKAATTYVDTQVATKANTSHTHTSAQISDATSTVTSNRVVIRDDTGRFNVHTPTTPAHPTPKTYVDTEIATRAPASHTHTPADVGASFAATSGTIPVRDSGGRLAALSPVAPGQVTNKAYVDQRPALFSGAGNPPSSITGAVVGDWWLNTTTMELFKITGV